MEKLTAEVRNGRVKRATVAEVLKPFFLPGEWAVVDGKFYRYFYGEHRYISVSKCGVVQAMWNIMEEILPGSMVQVGCSKLRQVLEDMEMDPQYCRGADFWELPEHLLNLKNGVFDLATGSFVTNERNFWPFRYCVDAQYLEDANIDTPAFDNFCRTSLGPFGYEDKTALLLEVIGYCLSAYTAGKCAMFMLGAPNSGKSVMLRFISNLLGPTAVLEGQICNVGLHQLGNRFYRQCLCTARLNVCGEIESKVIDTIEAFKAITGGDAMVTEKKFADPAFMRSRAKLLFAGNLLPPLADSDPTDAFINRLTVLIFQRSIPREERDFSLEEHLWVERDAIFTKAIGALMKLSARNFEFTCPADSEQFLDEYRKNINSFSQFLNEEIERSEGTRMSKKLFFEAYARYCKDAGLPQMPRPYCISMLKQQEGVIVAKMRIPPDQNVNGIQGLAFRTHGSEPVYISGEEYLARKEVAFLEQIMGF